MYTYHLRRYLLEIRKKLEDDKKHEQLRSSEIFRIDPRAEKNSKGSLSFGQPSPQSVDNLSQLFASLKPILIGFRADSARIPRATFRPFR
jgi:hypothetical protein